MHIVDRCSLLLGRRRHFERAGGRLLSNRRHFLRLRRGPLHMPHLTLRQLSDVMDGADHFIS